MTSSPTTDATGPVLPPHIDETVQAISRLHVDHRQGATGLQRTVEQLTGFFSRPRAVGLLALGVAVWIGANLALEAGGGRAFDRPPYPLLQCVAAIAALFMTLFILVTQRREDELSELRGQLTLELAMLSEQKLAKVIDLMEELRRDLPMVADRVDHEAHALSRPADSGAVLEALRENQGASEDAAGPGD